MVNFSASDTMHSVYTSSAFLSTLILGKEIIKVLQLFTPTTVSFVAARLSLTESVICRLAANVSISIDPIAKNDQSDPAPPVVQLGSFPSCPLPSLLLPPHGFPPELCDVDVSRSRRWREGERTALAGSRSWPLVGDNGRI